MLRSVPEVGTNLGTHSSRENFQADNWLKIVVGRDGIHERRGHGLFPAPAGIPIWTAAVGTFLRSQGLTLSF